MTGTAKTMDVAQGAGLSGLSSAEAQRRLAEFGPNAVEEKRESLPAKILRHSWAPVPWMLEATVALQLVIGGYVEAVFIAGILVFNIALGVFQESRADAALLLLKQHLSLKTRARRDGTWREVAAAALVPGDVVQISLGNIVPADLRIADGDVLLDQSMLTGESVPLDAGRDVTAYSGAIVRRGEAIGIVTATGPRTYFGRTAELVATAHVESSELAAVLGLVRNLTILNAAIVVGMVAYAYANALPASQIILLVLTALLSAIPVALPATFTLAAALGAREVAKKGVLLTRLSALHEAATIDVLCSDKTGTLTGNALAVTEVRAILHGWNAGDVLAYAALASSADGGDPVDGAIRGAPRTGGTRALPRVTGFKPFDPARKRTEAEARDVDGKTILIAKGAPRALEAMAPFSPAAKDAVKALDAAGYRTLAVAAGEAGAMELLGFVCLSDPPRTDSAALLKELQSLGVRTVMVTGDAPATAATIAHAIGLEGGVCPPGGIPARVTPDDYAIYAGVFPEDKFKLVRALQEAGHAVGMCGDGANDAPALRQAQMGIAVSTATDVAKAAAGIVLTTPGLEGIVTAIKDGAHRVPARPHLCASDPRQQMRDLDRARRGADPHRPRGADAGPAGDVDVRGRFRQHGARGRPRDAFAPSQCLAREKPRARGDPARDVQADLLYRGVVLWRVPTASDEPRIADAHLHHARLRGTGDELRAARAQMVLELAAQHRDAVLRRDGYRAHFRRGGDGLLDRADPATPRARTIGRDASLPPRHRPDKGHHSASHTHRLTRKAPAGTGSPREYSSCAAGCPTHSTGTSCSTCRSA
jgi:H+-transporting ATPase